MLQTTSCSEPKRLGENTTSDERQYQWYVISTRTKLMCLLLNHTRFPRYKSWISGDILARETEMIGFDLMTMTFLRQRMKGRICVKCSFAYMYNRPVNTMLFPYDEDIPLSSLKLTAKISCWWKPFNQWQRSFQESCAAIGWKACISDVSL